MTRSITRMIMVICVGYAAFVAASEPLFGPNPAFALRVEPQERLAAPRINPGYGE